MLRQSSSETSIALFRLPVIWIGLCEAAASSTSWYSRARAWVTGIEVMRLPYGKTYAGQATFFRPDRHSAARRAEGAAHAPARGLTDDRIGRGSCWLDALFTG